MKKGGGYAKGLVVAWVEGGKKLGAEGSLYTPKRLGERPNFAAATRLLLFY
jgi:hypothetical protein